MYRHLRAAAESGWDFSSRWFRDKKNFSSIHTTEIIPVDLNCLLYNLEKTIAEGYRLSNDTSSSLKFETAAGNRKAALDRYCWNDVAGFYFDYDYVVGKQKESMTLAAAFPLFFKMASKEQAAGVSKMLLKKFVYPGGLISTTETSIQQWDAPNGWAPLTWIAIAGLENYNQSSLAREVAKRWVDLNVRVFKKTGKLMEKYNVQDIHAEAGGGEYQSQDGFGWTNGVLITLIKKYNLKI